MPVPIQGSAACLLYRRATPRTLIYRGEPGPVWKPPRPAAPDNHHKQATGLCEGQQSVHSHPPPVLPDGLLEKVEAETHNPADSRADRHLDADEISARGRIGATGICVTLILCAHRFLLAGTIRDLRQRSRPSTRTLVRWHYSCAIQTRSGACFVVHYGPRQSRSRAALLIHRRVSRHKPFRLAISAHLPRGPSASKRYDPSASASARRRSTESPTTRPCSGKALTAPARA
jgi:hypothetical protein